MGLEAALSRVFPSADTVTKTDAIAFGKRANSHGLRVVGLHSLFYDRPDLCIFGTTEVRKETLQFLTHSSQMCAAMGGKTLVFGSPHARKKGELTVKQADELAASFLYDVCLAINNHGTKLLLEPLGKGDSDYLHTLEDTRRVVNQVGCQELGLHFDAKAMAEAGEISEQTVREYASQAMHCHVNEMDLGALKADSPVNHDVLGRSLREGGYTGWISLEQRMVNQHDCMPPLRQSMSVLMKSYQHRESAI